MTESIAGNLNPATGEKRQRGAAGYLKFEKKTNSENPIAAHASTGSRLPIRKEAIAATQTSGTIEPAR
jgi:hypothetical protein